MKYFIGEQGIKQGGNLRFTSLSFLYEWLADKDEITLDLETSAKKEYYWYSKAGLDPYTSNICMLQIGNSVDQFAIDVRDFNRKEIVDLISYIRDKNLKVIGHNLKFDLKMIVHHYSVILENIYDTMLNEMILTTGLKNVGYSLEALTKRYLFFSYAKTNQLDLFGNNESVGLMTKDTRKQFVQLGDNPFSLQQIDYGLSDIIHTAKIANIQSTRVVDDKLTVVSRLEHKFLLTLVHQELNGFHIDTEMWKEQYERNKSKLDLYYSELKEYISNNNISQFLDFQLTLFEAERSNDHVNINLASSKQVIELCKVLGIPTKVLDKTKKKREDGEPSFKDTVEETHLKKYKDQYEIIPIYLKYRKYLKATGTYGLSFLEQHVNPVSNRVHSSFWQIVDSGRIASRGPNLQNIPSKKNFAGFRECFAVSDNSWLIVTDYANQEGRVMADAADEENMITFFNTGDGDLHSHTARLMFKIHVSETWNANLRQKAKVLNFGIPYGSSAHKIAETFNVSLEEAEEFISMFFSSYPKLRKFFDRKIAETLSTGYVLVDEITGRKSYGGKVYETYLQSKSLINILQADGKKVPSVVWSDFFKSKGILERMSQNYAIQGRAASMTKLACILMWEKIKTNNLFNEIKIVNVIHDEIVLEVTDEYVKLASEWIETAMVDAGKVFCKKVAMVAKPYVSKSWEH